MSEKKISVRRVARCCLAAAVGLQMFTSLPLLAASSAPLKTIDRGARVRMDREPRLGRRRPFFFELEQSREAGAPSLNFLAGGGPEFTLGCTSIDAAKSYWRFRVDFTPPGQGITGRQEIAHEKGVAHYLGAPGTIILFDETDKEMKRFPLQPNNGGLETERLEREDVQSFLNASAIRAETPRIVFESGTLMLKGSLDRMSKLPCAAR